MLPPRRGWIERVLTTGSARQKGFLQRLVQVLGISGITAVLLLAHPAPARGQYVLGGGYSGVLGIYLSAGRILRLTPSTTLTLGGTYTEVRRIEPLISMTYTRPLARGWTLALTGSYGGVSGDYRVEKFPEVSLTRGGRVLGTPLTYAVDLGLGNYTVWPTAISGLRLHAAASVSTPSIALGPARASAAVGYRHHVYVAATNTAAWGSVHIAAAPLPQVSVSLTYFRQIASGSSPLLFDAMGSDHYVAGTLSFQPVRILTFSHSQTYSLISRSISARVYGVSVALSEGQAVGASWDDVARKVTVSYSRSGLGSFSVFWYVP